MVNIKDEHKWIFNEVTSGFVYYLQLIETTIFKIGKAKNLEKRIKQLTTQNIKWELKYFILTNDRHALEIAIHDINHYIRIGTSELFEFSKLSKFDKEILDLKFNRFKEYGDYEILIY